MFQGHIQAKGEKGQSTLPDPTKNGGILTGAATQRRFRLVTEIADNCTLGYG